MDYSDDGPALLISSCVLGFFSTIIVGLRFWSRKLVGTPWGLDDWLTVASLLAHHAVVVTVGFMTQQGGLGRDIRVIVAEEPEDIAALYKVRHVRIVSYKSISNLSYPLGPPCSRTILLFQFLSGQAVTARFLPPNIPNSKSQDRLLGSWRCNHWLGSVVSDCQPGSVHTSEGLLGL